MPLFKATNDGIVELKMKAINNLGDTTYIVINDDTFSNVSVGTGGIFPDAECTFTDWCMNSNVEYTIKFKVKMGKTYWVKACPSTNDSLSKITTTSIIIESEQ